MVDSILSLFTGINYPSIFILMAMESSILPVPSELVMIPAGWLAAEGTLDPILATIVGGLWSIFWALVNYFIIGKYIGKPFLLRYGKYILITHEKYERTEKLFLKNQNLYTFLGRLLPVIRHLISIPAGIFSMPLMPFVLLTGLGATLWCGILVWIGYTFGQDMVNIVRENTHLIGIGILPIIALWLWFKIWKK